MIPESRWERFVGSYDIESPTWVPPSWESKDIRNTLEQLRLYVEKHAQEAIEWYRAKKPGKAFASRWLRGGTIIFAGIGGLIVAAAGVLGEKVALKALGIQQIGYIFFGLAALVLAFDHFFGSSTAWMRYVTAATSLETALEQFRLDWARMGADLNGKIPEGKQLEDLIQRIAEFSVITRTIVEKETQAWITEFQMNLSQLEKETKAAVDAARTRLESLQKQRALTEHTGKPRARRTGKPRARRKRKP